MTARFLALFLLWVTTAFGQFTLKYPTTGSLDNPTVGPVTLTAFRSRLIGDAATRLADPDGEGPGKNAEYDGAVATGVRTQLNAIRGGSDYNWGGFIFRAQAHAAMMALMCEQCVTPWNASLTWKQFAISALTNAYEWGRKAEWGNHFQTVDTCSTTLNLECVSDYGGPMGQYTAIAYSILRDWMTPQQRADSAQRALNGFGKYEPCDVGATVRAGVVSVSGNVATLSGATWHSDVVVGQHIMLRLYKVNPGDADPVRPVADPGNNYQGWAVTVTAINSPTQLTFSGSVWAGQQMYYLTYNQTHQSGQCGMMPVRSMHGNMPGYAFIHRGFGIQESLPATDWPLPEGGVTTQVTMSGTLDSELALMPPPTPTRPWSGQISDYLNAEHIEIIGISGTQVTIRRGRTMHGRAWNGPVGMAIYTKSPRGSSPEGLNNRELTRSVSYLALSLAFAGDDARADEMLPSAVSYFYDSVWAAMRQNITSHNYSMQGYGYGRGTNFLLPQQIYLQNAIPGSDYRAGIADEGQIYSLFYGTTPWIRNEWLEDGVGWGALDCQASMSSQVNCGGILPLYLSLYGANDLSRMMWEYFRNKTTFWTTWLNPVQTSNWNSYGEIDFPLWAMLSQYQSRLTAIDYAATLPTARINLGGANRSGGAFGSKTLHSKTGWGLGDTIVGMRSLGPSDKTTGEVSLAGAYAIGRRGWHINGGGWSGRNGGSHQGQAHFLFGNKWDRLGYGNYANLSWPSVGTVNQNVRWLATDIKEQWLRTFVGQGDPNGLTGGRAVRNIVHFPGSDLVISFEEISKSVNSAAYFKIPYTNDLQSNTNCGTNNSNGCRIEKNYRTVLEGSALFDLANKKVISTTGGDVNEGAASRLITTWLPSGANTIEWEADFTAAALGIANGQVKLQIGQDCSVSKPCKIRANGQDFSWTSLIGEVTPSYAGGCGGCLGYVFVWFQPDTGTFHAAQSGGYSQPTATGAITIEPALNGDTLPAGAIQVAFMRYNYSGTENFYACGYDMSNSGNPQYYHHLCAGRAGGGSVVGYDSVRQLQLKLASTTTPAMWFVHKVTDDTNDTTAPATAELVVTGGNHRALQIGSGSSTHLAVMALNPVTTRATSLSLTTTQGPAKLFATGLAEGDYSVTWQGGSTTTSIGTGESSLYVEGVAVGSVTITRTGAATLTVLTASLPSATVGAQYTACLSASGGTPGYSWVSIGDALPGWASLNGATGCITGIPNAPATTSHQFRTTDSQGVIANSGTLSLVVNPVSSVVMGPCPSAAVQNQSYAFTLTATGGSSPYTYSHSGGLPTGISRSGASLSGTPTVQQTVNVTFTVTDNLGSQNSRACSMIVNGAAPTLEITTQSLPNGTEGTPYSQTVVASGVTGTGTWDVSSGVLPTGLSIGGQSGTVSGTPSAPGTYNFTLRITDSVTNATKPLSITIAPSVPALTAVWSSTNVIWNAATSQTVCTASGGTGPYTFSVTGLPEGLSMNSSGLLTGTTVVEPKAYQVVCTATDANQVTAQANGSVTVVPLSTSLTLEVIEAWNTGAKIKVGRSGQSSGATCRAYYSAAGGQTVTTAVSMFLSRQGVFLESLTPGTAYSLTMVCDGHSSQTVSFNTPSVNGTSNVAFQWSIPPFYAAASLDVEVAQGNGAFSAPANYPCSANVCTVSLNNLQRGDLYRLRRTIKDAGGATLGSPTITRFVVR